ncbi:ATP-dependent DNA ligase [Allohahella marinimesophila]|uniref:DNA ligase (ATP) n=1 Tax=Allohahella marinimesophila TaxID=1054972 RepID=A0ABP7NQR0_9GAMM
MKAFTALFEALDTTTSTNEKIDALVRYFRSCDAADGAWAAFLLSGLRSRRAVSSRLLRQVLVDPCGWPEWIVDECYSHVGDIAETVALLLKSSPGIEPVSALELPDRSLASWMAELRALVNKSDEVKREWFVANVLPQPPVQCFVLCKMAGGSFRVGVSRGVVAKALAKIAELPPAVIQHRLAGQWEPSAEAFESLISQTEEADPAKPYPFCLAYPLEPGEKSIHDILGDRAHWLAEWKYDGIRAQLIRREGTVMIWSRGEDMINAQFPEIERAVDALAYDCVLDAELLAWSDEPGVEAEEGAGLAGLEGRPSDFNQLQRRLGRKKVSEKMQRDIPIVCLIFDCLEFEGEDLRQRPLTERRSYIDRILQAQNGTDVAFRQLRSLPPVVVDVSEQDTRAEHWQGLESLRQESRERGVEGLMLKRLDSVYEAGRVRGGWWKWKIEPYTVDAVMLYAQAGHGRRSNLYTDYTFAVWDGENLVPFAKAYSGLTDAEIRRLDHWIRRHTIERFGPVRSVEPLQVFELAFEGIARSTRHKSGIAVRFPRISRWREDKTVDDIDTLETISALIDPPASSD